MNKKNKVLTNLELSSFCKQMSMILKAGISPIEGISMMIEDSQNKNEKQLLEKIYEDLTMTSSLAISLKKTSVFPNYMIQMLEIGEETGRNDEVMDALSHHYQREEMILQSIKNAITYPMIMILMMVVIIVILMTKVMPIFNQVFQQLGHEMTGLSKGILLLGNTLSKYAAVFIIILLIVIGFIFYLLHNKNGKEKFKTIFYHFKGIKNLFHKIYACRLAGGMSLSLKSGLPFDRCIELSKELVYDKHFQKEINDCQNLLDEGSSLAKSFHDSHIFTGVQSRMLNIAEKAGQVDSIMDDIADQLEDEIDEKISSYINILEPTLVIILSIIVGVILLSVMLPLLGIMSNI